MAPFVPEELDVFTIPHSRMKELVSNYVEKNLEKLPTVMPGRDFMSYIIQAKYAGTTSQINAAGKSNILCNPTPVSACGLDCVIILERTNFSDYVDMQVLLRSLSEAFSEFKKHEQIENNLIMKKLKNKLQQLSIKNSAVCNCHKDSHLTEILHLVEDGYTKKTVLDRVNYGLQLRKKLEDFTEDFLPHMKQEEEIFQPLLLQHFTYKELCELRKTVIQLHLEDKHADDRWQFLKNLKEAKAAELHKKGQDEKDDYCNYLSEKETRQSEKEGDVCEEKEDEVPTDKTVFSEETLALPDKALVSPVPVTVLDLPHELMLKVMTYLSPWELCRAGQVCREWSIIAKDPLLWRNLHPVKWARGEWYYQLDGCLDEDEVEDEEASDGEQYILLDEDADIDESSESEEDAAFQQIRREAKLLSGLVKYVLPAVGKGVKVLNLAHSKALTSALLHRMLKYCPNVEHLDLTQTKISDSGLRRLGKNYCGSQLKKVILSGCVNITDSSLLRLAMALTQPAIVHDVQTDPHTSSTNNLVNGTTSNNIVTMSTSNFTMASNNNLVTMATNNITLASNSNLVTMATNKNVAVNNNFVSMVAKNEKAIRQEDVVEIQDMTDDDKKVAELVYVKQDDAETVRLDDIENVPRVKNKTVLKDAEWEAVLQLKDAGLVQIADDFCLCAEYVNTRRRLAWCQLPWPYGAPVRTPDGARGRNAPQGRMKGGGNPKAGCCGGGGASGQTAGSCCMKDCGNIPGPHDAGPAAAAEDEADHHPPPQSFQADGVPNPVIARDKPLSTLDTMMSVLKSDCSRISVMGVCHPSCVGDNTQLATDAVTRMPASHRSLQYLSISGCYQITDLGLSGLAGCGPFLELWGLDLSGCSTLTGPGIEKLVDACPALDPQYLYYCDNILDGPLMDTASGCRNQSCGARYCCRTLVSI